MLSLTLKDFRANWMYQALGYGLLFAMSTAYVVAFSYGNELEVELYIIGVVLSCLMLSNLFLFIDEFYQMHAVFASLPVTRNQIIRARYLSVFLQISIALIIHIAGIQVASLFLDISAYRSLEILFRPGLWLSILGLLLLFISFSYPFYFKFGMLKGNLIIGIIFFSMMVLGIVGSILFRIHFNIVKHLQAAINWMAAQPTFIILFLLTGFFLFMMGSSIGLSAKFYKNKDL